MLTVQELGYLPRDFGPISFGLKRGEIVFLGGLSGSGKSTLCELLCGQLEASFGLVSWDEGIKMGYVAQEFENQLLGSSVEQELLLSEAGVISSSWSGDPRLEPFESFRGTDPHSLPPALQQRLIMECLCRSGAQVLILDESLATLDSSALDSTGLRLQGLAEQGVAILLVSHDLRLLPISTRVLGLESGRVAFDLPLGEVGPPEVQRLGLWGGTAQFSCQVPFLVSSENSGARPLWDAGEFCCPEGSLVGLAAEPDGTERGILDVLGDPDGQPRLRSGEEKRASVARLPFRARSILWRRTVAVELEESLRQGRSATAEEGLVPATWLERNPRQLSVGQSRYLAALCLVLQRPDLLLLEEPFLGLDGFLRANLLRAVRGYLHRAGTGLFTSRHPDELELYSGSLVALRDGHARVEAASLSWSPGQALPEEIRTRLGPTIRERPLLAGYV